MVLALLVIAAFGGEFCVETEDLPCWSIGALINGLSTVSIDFLYSSLKVVTKPLDTKHKKATFQDKEN